MSRRYTRGMNDMPATPVFRCFIAAALLASLAACGNKGPLVKASQAAPADAQAAPADAQSPPAGDPTEVTPPDEVPPPVTEPVSTPSDVPPADDGGGNG
jgi:predicted small lipoprotein YifL